MLYAHRKFLIHVTQATEDGELITQNGTIPVFAGNRISHNELGEPFVMTDDYFKRNYLPVEKVKVIPNFAETFEQQCREFSSLEQEDDKDYIETFQSKVRERNNIE